MTLRPYQVALVEAVRAEWARGMRRVVMQLGTGGGKTHTAASVIATEPGPVVFAAHLDTLVRDTAARLRAHGVPCGIVAPWADPSPGERVQVASLGTLHARGLAPPADLVILDECHRGRARTVQEWLERYPRARMLGLTATPQRGDGAPLGAIFESMVSGPTVPDLQSMGSLVPTVVYTVRKGAADAAVEILRHPECKRFLVFCTTIAEARAMAARLEAEGMLRTGVMLGDTPSEERERLRLALRSGELDVLVNVGVAVEGWDEPSVDCVVLDAPFGTVGRYLQAVGRGMRPASGKSCLTVLDVRGAVWLHGLPDEARRWSLTGEAVERTEKGLAIATCKVCMATFRSGPAACPRCGAPMRVAEVVPRPLTREERAVRYDAVPLDERRKRYVARLTRIAVERMRMGPVRAAEWAEKETARRLGP